METSAPAQQPLHEFLRQHAREQPDKAAYVWYGRAISFAELDRTSDAFAARLAQLGVKKGEPVALFMNNCPQYIVAHYAVQKIGAIVCPCGPLFKEHELRYQLEDLKARVIVAAQPLLPVVDKVRADTAIEHVFVVRYADLLPEAPSVDVPVELLAMKQETPPLPAGCEDFLAAAVLNRALRYVSMAPLGMPGVPDVEVISATSSMPTSTGAGLAPLCMRSQKEVTSAGSGCTGACSSAGRGSVALAGSQSP